MLFHGDQALYMATTNWTRVLGVDKAFTAFRAYTQMSTGHDNCVLCYIKTDQALLVLVCLHFNVGFAFNCVMLLHHPIYCFDLEWQPINQYDLLKEFNPANTLILIQCEDAVADHCEWLIALLVIDAYDQGEVTVCRFGQLEPDNEVEVELNGAFLIETLF